MPKLVAVTPESHGAKRWLPLSSYRFAAGQIAIPLVAMELPKAMLSMPIALIRDNEQKYFPVGLAGITPGKNLFVADDGHWRARYVPAVVRGYPFRLARREDHLLLCVDEDSGLVTDGPEGEPFFSEDGSPAPKVKETLDFLGQVERNRAATVEACSQLERHGCVKPWTVTVKSNEAEQPIQGLFHVDATALNALPDETFLELRGTGALLLAYCQLLSEEQLQVLGRLADALAKAAVAPPRDNGELDLSFFSRSETLHFGGPN